MGVNIRGILAAIEDHKHQIGYFETIAMHEPKSAPGPGITAATFVQSTKPLDRGSGLKSTTVLVVVYSRLMMNMLYEPQDEIDPRIYDATDRLMESYHADLSLLGTARNIDVFGGLGGVILETKAGYVQQDRKALRAVDVITPVIVNDAYTQST